MTQTTEARTNIRTQLPTPYPGYYWAYGPRGWLQFPIQRQAPVAVQTVNVNVGNNRNPGRAYTRPAMHHGAHIVASVLTAGAWLPFYAVAYVWSKVRPRTVTSW